MKKPDFIAPKFVGLKSHPVYTERWLHGTLKAQPELLQLGGDLYVKDSERTQPTGGRLDLLLADRESETRYEVEIQLGATDPSHIIRTIEYWEVERRRFPQYEHVAVIVAEDVTSRFLNVISLFNRAIPMIAIQIKGVEVNGAFTLVSTRVLDLVMPGEEEERETVDRRYWEQRASKESLNLVDQGMKLIGQAGIAVTPNYTKRYIGLLMDDGVRNFVSFVPKKGRFTNALFKIREDEDLTGELDDAGLATLAYNTRFGQYRVRLTKDALTNHEDLLLRLIRIAHEPYSSA